MSLQDNEIFKIAFLKPASDKIKLGFLLFSILISILSYTLIFTNPKPDKKSAYYTFNNWTNTNIPTENIIFITAIIIFFIFVTIVYIIYEQQKHSIYFKLEKNKITILHKLKNKLVEKNEINKDDINNISVYIKNIGNNKHQNRIVILSVKNKTSETQEFRIPLKTSFELLEKLEIYNYPIPLESKDILKQEKHEDNLDKFVLKASIIGFSIFFLFAVSFIIFMAYLEINN